MTNREAVEVSIVTPTYNRSEQIERLLRSLWGQSLGPDVEVVVSTDGCTDDTERVVGALSEEVPFRLRLVSHPKKTGAGPARNRGWHAASGQWIVFIDDDCVPAPNWFSELRNDSGNADVCVGATEPAPDQLNRRGPFSTYMQVRSKDCYPTCNIGYSRSVLEALGGFDEDRYRRHNGEDTDLGLRAEKAGYRSSFVPNAIVYHDVRESKFRPYMARVVDREALVALVARHPEARRRLSDGWWLRPTDKAIPFLWASAIWLAKDRRSLASRLAVVAAACFYLWQWRHSYYRPRSVSEFIAALPGSIAADTWSLIVMSAASARYRVLVL